VRPGFREVREVAVCQVRPAGRLADQVDLRLAFRPPHARHPRLALYLDERRQCGPLVAHHARRAVGVREDGLGTQFRQHPRRGVDGVAAGVVEVVVNGVDSGVLLDAFDFQARHRDFDAVRGDREDHRPFGLDVGEAGEVLDARRVEPDTGVGGRFVDPIADRRQPLLELVRGESRAHTTHDDAPPQKRSRGGDGRWVPTGADRRKSTRRITRVISVPSCD